MFFSYVHYSGSTSNLDFVLSGHPELQSTTITVSDDILSSDHLHLQFNIYMSPSQNKTIPCRLTKVLLDHIVVSSFQYILDSLLMKIKIPFHLLSTSLKGNPLDIDCFLADLTHSLKVAFSVPVPSIRVKIGTQKRSWKEDDELQDT